jgi:hypothetical protein
VARVESLIDARRDRGSASFHPDPLKKDSREWAGSGGHFFFWRRGFGPLRVNRYFAFVDAAKIDKDNGQYYQIGIIKY